MDTATHALVPYALALLALGVARRQAVEADARAWRAGAGVAAVVGVAAAAPDLDGIYDFLKHRAGLWWLQHRGFSHTLVGAPLHGLAAVGALALAARRWPVRFGLFRWRAAFVPAIIVGALTHLVLDGITLSGVPLPWPLTDGRVAFPLFHWLVWWLFPVSLGVLLVHVFGFLDRRWTARAGVGVLAVLVVLVGVRAWQAPWDEGELGTTVFPRQSPTEWIVLERHANLTVEARLVRDGELLDRAWFEHRVPRQAEDAVARARDSSAYRGFAMGAFGPVTVIAEPLPAPLDAQWRVTFTAPAQRFEALHDPSWTPADPQDSWGFVTFVVEPGGGLRVEHRGW